MYIQIRVGVGSNKVETSIYIYPDDNNPVGEYVYNFPIKLYLKWNTHKDNRVFNLLLEKEKQLNLKFENSFKENSDVWEKVFKDKIYLKTKINIYDTAFEIFSEEGLNEWLDEKFEGLFLDLYNEAKELMI